MKKKILALLIAIVSVFACVAFTACGDGDKNNYSETYEGTLSTEAYTTADGAAAAFVANEVNSESTPVTYKSYEKQKDLTEDEIAKLNLSEAEIADVKSAEKGKIVYTKNTPSTVALSAAPAPDAPEELSKVVYIVEFNTPAAGGSIKYLAPLPENGEALTKSYLESVFNPEDYKNCTTAYEMPITIKMSQGGISMSVEMNIKYTLRITETAIEMVMTLKMPEFTSSDKINYVTETVTSYLVDSPNGILQATLVETDWQVDNFTTESGIAKIEDMFAYNLPDADYSYFVKTSTGFKMSDEYLNDLMEEIINEAELGELVANGNFSSKISADYYVTEGKLDNEKIVLTMSATEGQGKEAVTTTITIKATNKYSAFGTTVVEIPQDAKNAIEDAKTSLGIAE